MALSFSFALSQLVNRVTSIKRRRCRWRWTHVDPYRPWVEWLEHRTLLTAGSLDAAFGTGGLVTTGFLASANDTARGLVIQSDGKVVVAGTANGDFALARYNAQGVLDAGFGSGGRATTDFGATDDAYGVALQSDGKIVVVGSTSFGSGTANFALARFTVNGLLDGGFGSGGKVITDFAFGDDRATGVIVQPDDKIVAVGVAITGGTSNFALARYSANGVLDPTFGNDPLNNPLSGSGRVATDFGASQDQANAVARQSADGKLVVAGLTSAGPNSNFAIARYDSNGILDVGFGNSGKVATDFAGGNDQATGVAIQSSGRIVVAGSASFGFTFSFAVARYNTNGSLDDGGPSDSTVGDSFGFGGKVTTSFGSGPSQAFGVAVQSDDKIVVAGSAQLSTSDFALARYTASGSPDSGFGSGGTVTTDFASSFDQAVGVVVQGSNIVLAGSSGSDFALAGYGATGAPDNNFDTDGKLTTDFFVPASDIAQSIVVQPDGKIVVAGSSGLPSGPFNNFVYDFALARYNPDGSLDTDSVTGFGPLTAGPGSPRTGRVTTDFGGGTTDEARSIALQTNGKIVVAGSSGFVLNDSSFDFALARYNTDGSLDTSFDGDGKVTTDFGLNLDQAYSVAVQSDGKIVAAGFASVGGQHFALARYNTNGSLDTNLSTGFGPVSGAARTGKVTTNFGFGTDQARAMALQPDGRIVVAGIVFVVDNFNFAIARYDASGNLDPTFDTDGKVTTEFGTSPTGFNARSDGAASVAIRSDGMIVVAGNSSPFTSGDTPDFALARYTPTGALDTTFGNDPPNNPRSGTGKILTDFGGNVDQANGVVIQTDGKIVAAGWSAPNGPGNTAFALARYTTAGVLDTSFDTDGKVTTDFGGTAGPANGVALQPDGKIILAGYAAAVSLSNADFALARYEGGPVSDVFWDGEAGDFRWDTPLNWSTNQLPTSTQNAFINFVGITVLHSVGTDSIKSLYSLASLDLSGGSLSLTEASTITGDVSLSGATLAGSGDLTATGLLNWTGGTMSGTGTTFANGEMNISGATTKNLDGRTLSNAGSATWTGTGNIDLRNGAQLVNEATFDVTGDASMVNGGGAAPLFDNQGTFQKSDGAVFPSPSRTHIAVPFDNHGTVEVTKGTVDLSGGGTSTGNFAIQSGSPLLVTDASQTYTLDTGTTITGTGYFNADGHVRIAGSDVPAQNVAFSIGIVDGAGTLRVLGNLKWFGGRMAGTGQTVIDPGAAGLIAGGGSGMVLDGRTFRNKGTTTWANGELDLRNGAQLVNEATFDVTGDASMVNGGGAAPLFDNQGTFQKTAGTGTTAVAVPFNNAGTVNVQIGTVDFSGGGTSTGTFTIAAASSLVFENDTSVSGLIAGPGSLRKAGAGTLVLSANNGYTGATTVDGGTLLVNGSQPNSPVTVNSGGTLGGTGTTGAVAVYSGGTVSPGTTPGILRTGSVVFSPNSTFRVELNGHDAGTGYDQLKVTGEVILGGANLNLSLGFSPGNSDRTFVLIDNDGKKDDVVGIFNGLPQDTVITLGGKQFLIDYKGGDGNDVLLHRVGALQALGGAASASDASASLTPQALLPVVTEAIASWGASETDRQALSMLINVGVHVADLPDRYLGMASEHDIWIDRDAAGYGWSIGPNLADGRMDLLTVVAHELGHVLGYEHSDDAGDLMAEALPAGVRHFSFENTLAEGPLETWNAAATGSGPSLWATISTRSPSTSNSHVAVKFVSGVQESLALLSLEPPTPNKTRSRWAKTLPLAALDAAFAEGEGNWLDSARNVKIIGPDSR